VQRHAVRERIARSLQEGAELHLSLLKSCAEYIAQSGIAIVECLRGGGKVLLFGNGGSAADAQHIASEFLGRFSRDRAPLPALALTTDTSTLTAVGNDYGFEQIFARQVQALGKPGDVALAISTSGRSANVLAGIEAARKGSLTTIGFAGGDGGALAGLVDIPIVVPSANTARIQECHIAVGHILCEVVETLLFAVELPGNGCGEVTDPQPTTRNRKVVDWDTLLSLRKRWRAEGKSVVWTNGCFDLLHVGHVRSLQAARKLGDVLVVGVNEDDSVQKLKGAGRPIVTASERVEVLASLEAVDYVVMFNDPTPKILLSRLQPDVHCKGEDYAPPHGKLIPEAEVVKSYGGRVEFLPLFPSISTSDLIRRNREQNGQE
jgi:phosphoheptose isomerase